MRRVTICLALLLLVCCSVFGLKVIPFRSSVPSFCHGLDCPAFNTTYLDKSTSYEERVYPSATNFWVRTKVEGTDYDHAVSIGFRRLFSYISGSNDRKEKIDMTAPVTTQILPGTGPTCNSTFIVSFFVPFSKQSNPPQPTDSQVYLDRVTSDQKIALVSFPGYANKYNEEVLPQIQKLTTLAQKRGITITDKTTFFTAGYDSPFRIIDRHNEVWFQY